MKKIMMLCIDLLELAGVVLLACFGVAYVALLAGLFFGIIYAVIKFMGNLV
jgi:hypothetical protein